MKAHSQLNGKVPKVVPLHKKGNVNDVKQIIDQLSILSTTSKIIERVVHKQFYE